jgi:DNA-3-methyladenine glycosylase II
MLEYDPNKALRHLAEADPKLGRLIERLGAFELEVRTLHSPFEALLRSIVFQQLSGKAAGTIYGRVQALFTEAVVHPEALLALPEEQLRGAGMSRAKTAAARDLAAKTLDGTVPTLDVLRQLSDEEIIDRLVAVRGIGPWTAEMLLIFRLGRPDVLPVTDLGVRKGYMLAYGLDELPKPAALKAYGERWRPYRSVASWYLWRVVDQDDGTW